MTRVYVWRFPRTVSIDTESKPVAGPWIALTPSGLFVHPSLPRCSPATRKVRVRVQADRLRALAAIDQVRHIEPVLKKKLWNNVARGLMGADHVQSNATLEGANQIGVRAYRVAIERQPFAVVVRAMS